MGVDYKQGISESFFNSLPMGGVPLTMSAKAGRGYTSDKLNGA